MTSIGTDAVREGAGELRNATFLFHAKKATRKRAACSSRQGAQHWRLDTRPSNKPPDYTPLGGLILVLNKGDSAFFGRLLYPRLTGT